MENYLIYTATLQLAHLDKRLLRSHHHFLIVKSAVTDGMAADRREANHC